MKRKFVIMIAIMATSLLVGCVSIFGPHNGEVVDKATGLPIENVVVIRSWSYGDAGPGGAVHRKAKYVEIVTKKDGRYFFWPDIFFRPIPLFTWTEANPILFYKPGYDAFESEYPPSVVKLGALPANRSVRKKELQRAENNSFLYESNLLKQVVTEERKVVKNLPEYTVGVLYKMDTNYANNINGIALDNKNNIYISTRGYVNKLLKTESGYQAKHAEIDDDYSPNYPIQIASDTKGNIYFLQNGFLKVQNINSPDSNTFKTEVNPDRLRDIGFTKIINSDFQPKNKGQAGFPNDNRSFTVSPNGNLQFGPTSLTTEGKLITTINATPDPSIINNPENVETVFDNDGNLYIVYNDKNMPSKNAIAISATSGEQIKWQYNVIDKSISGIALSADNIYICDNDSFYRFDKTFKIIEHKLLPENIFGKVRISGIKVDRDNKNLILIDREHARLLSYNLEANQWNSF